MVLSLLRCTPQHHALGRQGAAIRIPSPIDRTRRRVSPEKLPQTKPRRLILEWKTLPEYDTARSGDLSPDGCRNRLATIHVG